MTTRFCPRRGSALTLALCLQGCLPPACGSCGPQCGTRGASVCPTTALPAVRLLLVSVSPLGTWGSDSRDPLRLVCSSTWPSVLWISRHKVFHLQRPYQPTAGRSCTEKPELWCSQHGPAASSRSEPGQHAEMCLLSPASPPCQPFAPTWPPPTLLTPRPPGCTGGSTGPGSTGPDHLELPGRQQRLGACPWAVLA